MLKTHSLNLPNDPSTNIFDDLPSLQPLKVTEPQDELDKFLSTEQNLNE